MRGKSVRKKVSSEVAALLVDAGLIVLVSLISPYRSERDAARERVGAGEFVEGFRRHAACRMPAPRRQRPLSQGG
jgi:adenylylsulfate kinase-like enzyme